MELNLAYSCEQCHSKNLLLKGACFNRCPNGFIQNIQNCTLCEEQTPQQIFYLNYCYDKCPGNTIQNQLTCTRGTSSDAAGGNATEFQDTDTDDSNSSGPNMAVLIVIIVVVVCFGLVMICVIVFAIFKCKKRVALSAQTTQPAIPNPKPQTPVTHS